MTEITRLSACEMADAIASRELSSVEILEAHLARIEAINPKLNAIVTLAADEARVAARAADQKVAAGEPLGPLHGLPVLIKDVTLTKGIRTTYGSPLYKDFVPEADAEVVVRLRAAGAIILGKTNTPEFAAGANTVNPVFGATRNPWNTDLSPAGSSGGSAAAVAACLTPLAQGTDFGCSIRIPASFCGIVGIRTTPGLIPNRPLPMPWDPGQVHGPLARSAEDAALMLDAMTGFDPLWPISLPPLWQSARAEVARFDSAKGLRVAYVTDISGLGVDEEVDAICAKAAQRLVAYGAQVDQIAFDLSDGFAPYKKLRGEWMVGQQFERLDQLEKFGPNLQGNVKDGLKVTITELAAAEGARQRVQERMREFFGKYDLLMTPAAPVTPYPISKNFPDEINGKKLENYIDWIAQAFLITLVSFPAASVPAGKSKANLPVGLQIVGPRLSEPRLLGVGKLIAAQADVGFPPIG
jgi:amidase